VRDACSECFVKDRSLTGSDSESSESVVAATCFESAFGLEEHHKILAWRDSIYDETFVVALRHGHVKDGKWHYSNSSFLHVTSLLLLNFVLQAIVLWKVKSLSDGEKRNFETGLKEVCEDVDHRNLSFSTKLPVQPEDHMYVDCSPLSFTLMTMGLTILDTNKDGFWDAHEATQVMDEMERKFGREANVPLVRSRLLGFARRGELVATQGLDEGARAHSTSNFTRFPMSYLEKELPLIELCAAEDEHMCSNLEARHILKNRIILDDPDGPNAPDNRVEECVNVQSAYCPHMFGERYKYYMDKSAVLCGERMSFWNRTQKLRTVFYTRSSRFATGPDAVVTKPYMMFLYVILLIWFAAMVQEFREILLWWMMMYKLPVEETEHCLISHEESCFA